MRRHRAPALPGALALLCAVAALAAGCGDDGGTDDSLGSAESSGPTTETTTLSGVDGDVETEILDAYLAASEAATASMDPPDPNHPDLLATHDGEPLTAMQAALQRLDSEGASIVGETEHDAEVLSVGGDLALVRDCQVVDSRKVDTATGDPFFDEAPPEEASVTKVEVEMTRVEGTWKLTDQLLSEPDGCEPS